MADVPGNATTTSTIGVGGTVNGTLETIGDHDWYRIQLTAGQSISVALDGLTLEDSYLIIRDAQGRILYENDDISAGVNRDSLLAFTASYSGTYYIDVGAFDNDYTGAYQLSVEPYSPPPVWTNDQIADQLVNGYWNGDSHHFDVGQGGTITVNLTALTSAGQFFARQALALWSGIIGVNFVEVTNGGQITFDDNEDGAFAEANWSAAGIISSAHVNVDTAWIQGDGTNLNTYSFQTYIHEIGHALGLGHAGNYNGDARFPFDASYINDGWPATVMSYFAQDENSYYDDRGFSFAYVMSPMIADILAMSTLYGLSTATRTGNTTYGFNSNAGHAIYNAQQYPNIAYTVFDSGGTDTLDYSGYSANQVINLNPEVFFNVGGRVGNVAIARGVTIENAIGGSGNDQLIGNGAANALRGNGGVDTITGGGGGDLLTGGAGGDVFRDTAAGLDGDTIADFTTGDRIVITDASLASFTSSLSGSTLTFSGGSISFGSALSGQIVASAAAGGGVQLTLSSTEPPPPGPSDDARDDFNGDGRSDVLWRSTTGQLSDWLGQSDGGFAINDGNAFAQVPTSWQVTGTGDFNGDGRDDILWRSNSGQLSNWLGTADGGFTSNDANAFSQVPTSWQVVGIGDFNGDGRDDVLWRSNTGQVSDWLGKSNGGFTINDANAFAQVPTSWSVVGTGDFNGDGRDDIMWRSSSGQVSNWLGQADGGFVGNDANAFSQVPTSWLIVGTGDFDGDGRDDILWRSTSGQVSNWLGQADGGFVGNDANALAQVSTAWHVVGTGDYNGDGYDDVLWRNNSGQLNNWLGSADGGFTDNSDDALTQVPTSWHVQNPDSLFV